MKNLLTIAALSVVLFTACSDDKKITDLEHQNDSLKNELKSLKYGVDTKGEAFVLKELKLADLKKGIEDWQTQSTIKIPSAWVFEEDTLNKMLRHKVGNDTISGIMAYPMNIGGVLKIALVPYYKDANGKKYHFEPETALMAYDFSDMVPSIDGSGDHSVFNAEEFLKTKKEMCTFSNKACDK